MRKILEFIANNMLHTKKPDNFKPKFEVVGCFIEHEGKILLLLRQDHKIEPNTYGVPGWKINEWEDRHIAMTREILEETGIEIDSLSFFKEVYIQHATFDYVYHMYHKKFDTKPEIVINPYEHKKHLWISPKNALEEALMEDEDACIKMFYGI